MGGAVWEAQEAAAEEGGGEREGEAGRWAGEVCGCGVEVLVGGAGGRCVRVSVGLVVVVVGGASSWEGFLCCGWFRSSVLGSAPGVLGIWVALVGASMGRQW